MSKFHFEIEKLKEILLSSGYSNKFIDKCISKFMNKLCIKKPVMLTVPKKHLVLPFIGKMSALAKSGLIRNQLENSNHLENYFSFKVLLLNLYVLATFIILHVEPARLRINL